MGVSPACPKDTVNSSTMVFKDTDPQLCPAAPTAEIMHRHSVLSLRTPLVKQRQGFRGRQGPWAKAQAAKVDKMGDLGQTRLLLGVFIYKVKFLPVLTCEDGSANSSKVLSPLSFSAPRYRDILRTIGWW